MGLTRPGYTSGTPTDAEDLSIRSKGLSVSPRTSRLHQDSLSRRPGAAAELIGPTAGKGSPYSNTEGIGGAVGRIQKMLAVATYPNGSFPYITFICGYIAFQASYNVVTQFLRIRIRFGDPLRAWWWPMSCLKSKNSAPQGRSEPIP